MEWEKFWNDGDIDTRLAVEQVSESPKSEKKIDFMDSMAQSAGFKNMKDYRKFLNHKIGQERKAANGTLGKAIDILI